MRHFLIAAALMVFVMPVNSALAREGFWVSNKLTIGFNNTYIAIQSDVFRNQPSRLQLELGHAFEVHDNLEIVPRYILRLPKLTTPAPPLEHIIGLSLKLTYP